MENVLILTSSYFGSSSANGQCAKSINDELRKRGIITHILSIGEENITIESPNDIYIHYIRKKTGYIGKSLIMRRFRFGIDWIKGFIFGVEDKKLTGILKKYIIECLKRWNIDTIIAFYFPIENSIAASIVKGIHEDVKLIIYELDSIEDGIGSSIYTNLLYERQIKKCYKKADCVVIMESHKTSWLQAYKGFENIVQISDIPVFQDRELTVENRHIQKFLYAGILNDNYRSPIKLLSVFENLKEMFPDLIVDFYSKGCDETIKVFEDRQIINYKGYVNKEIIDKAILEADCLLSIGNSISNSVPSKIINYVSYMKPIIHFSIQDNDICEKYLNKYPLALVIKNEDDLNESRKKITEFLESSRKIAIDKNLIRQNFIMNTAQYSVDIICSI